MSKAKRKKDLRKETEMNKKELENIIKEYLKQHASLSVMCDPEGGGEWNVRVGLWLDNEKIADSSDTIIVSSNEEV